MKAAVKKSTLRNKADRLWSELIRTRDQECQFGGRECAGWVLQAAHIIPRSYRKTRWLEENGIGLCIRHHKYFTEHPIEWEQWIEERIGRKGYVLLREQALFGPTPDYDELIPALEVRLGELS